MTAIILYFLAAHGVIEIPSPATPELLWNGFLLGTTIDVCLLTLVFTLNAALKARTGRGRYRNAYRY